MVTLVATKAVNLESPAEFAIFFGAPLALVDETSEHLTAIRGAISITFSGDAFSYDGLGNPTGGTITSIVVSTSGTSAYSFAGLSIELLSFANAPDFNAVQQILLGALTGGDRLNGSPFQDVLSGVGGRDNILGRGGDDYLLGGRGKGQDQGRKRRRSVGRRRR